MKFYFFGGSKRHYCYVSTVCFAEQQVLGSEIAKSDHHNPERDLTSRESPTWSFGEVLSIRPGYLSLVHSRHRLNFSRMLWAESWQRSTSSSECLRRFD